MSTKPVNTSLEVKHSGITGARTYKEKLFICTEESTCRSSRGGGEAKVLESVGKRTKEHILYRIVYRRYMVAQHITRWILRPWTNPQQSDSLLSNHEGLCLLFLAV